MADERNNDTQPLPPPPPPPPPLNTNPDRSQLDPTSSSSHSQPRVTSSFPPTSTVLLYYNPQPQLGPQNPGPVPQWVSVPNPRNRGPPQQHPSLPPGQATQSTDQFVDPRIRVLAQSYLNRFVNRDNTRLTNISRLMDEIVRIIEERATDLRNVEAAIQNLFSDDTLL